MKDFKFKVNVKRTKYYMLTYKRGGVGGDGYIYRPYSQGWACYYVYDYKVVKELSDINIYNTFGEMIKAMVDEHDYNYYHPIQEFGSLGELNKYLNTRRMAQELLK